MTRPIRLLLVPTLLAATTLLAQPACDRGGSASAPPPSVAQGDPLDITFVAHSRGEPIACGDDARMQLADLRFFVSELRGRDAATGEWHAMPFEDEPGWQMGSVALVDLENGEGACRGGTPEVHPTVRARTPRPDIDALEFVVGVPFALNHGDPTEAPGPLANTPMHWTWRSGYKFLRFEAIRDGLRYRAHIGSTLCEGTIGNVTGCGRDNRSRHRVDGWVPGTPVVVDLDRIEINLAFTDSGSGCMGANDDERCMPFYENLGVDPELGVNPEGFATTVFVAP